MTVATNRELIDQWSQEPAPLLPLLHALHKRDGFVSEDALRAIASGLRIPLADLFGTVTFYHHLAREPRSANTARVCTGPVCRMHGAAELREKMSADGATPMPCAGRCDDPVPVLVGNRVLIGAEPEALAERPSPLPPPNHQYVF